MDTTRPETGFAPPGPAYPVHNPAQTWPPQTEVAPGPATSLAPHPAMSAATRYLCVGAHVDPEFSDHVVNDILEDRHRAVAPSNGIDLIPVIRHALAARRRRLARDGAIIGLLVACLFVSPLPTAGLTFAGWTMGLVFHATKRWRQRGPARTLLQVAGVFVGLVVGSQVLAALALRQVLLGSPSAGVSQQVLGYLVLPIGVWGIVLIEAAQTRDVLAKRLSQPRYHPDGAPAVDNPEIRTRLEHLAREQYGNTTVYSPYIPFVGSGANFKTWSFVIDLQRPRQAPGGHEPGPPPRPVGVRELQTKVIERFNHLGDAQLHQRDRLAGLRLEPHVFVDGSSIRGSRLFLPDPTGTPQFHLAEDELERLADEHSGPVREYLDVRIGSWNEELVVTVHVHLSTTGRTLYLEAAACALLPINGAYRVVDAMPSHLTPGAMAELVGTATRTFAGVFCRVPVEVGGALLGPFRRWLRNEKTLAAIRENLAFDYGARTSVRELAAESFFHNYFQGLDVEKFRKLVDLHVVQVVLDHLEDAGVDTAAFREQRAFIMNGTTNQFGAGSTFKSGADMSFGNSFGNKTA